MKAAIEYILALVLVLIFTACGTVSSGYSRSEDGTVSAFSRGKSFASSTAADAMTSSQSIGPNGEYNRNFGAEGVSTDPDSELVSNVVTAAVAGAVAGITGNPLTLQALRAPSSPPVIEPAETEEAPQPEPVARNPPVE